MPNLDRTTSVSRPLALWSVFLLALLTAGALCAADLQGDYLGQEPPGLAPKIFAPGVVSVEGSREHTLAMSSKGDEIFFTRSTGWPHSQIMHLKRDGDTWSTPEVASFLKDDWATQPTFSPDGQSLIFSSSRGKTNIQHFSLWRSRKVEGAWSEPEEIVDLGGGPMMEYHPSVSRDGTLYFLLWDFGQQIGDLYAARLVDGKYAEPVKLAAPINTECNEVRPTVDPDGKFLLFVSNRPGGHGGDDIYICFRKEDGSWAAPKDLGAPVNTPDDDDVPTISSDGKYWFFCKNGDIYWRDAQLTLKAALADADANMSSVNAFETPTLKLGLAPESQTVAWLKPAAEADFDFTPGNLLKERSGNGFVYLGDLSLRLRLDGKGDWRNLCTWAERKPVAELPANGEVLAAADLTPTLGECPLRIVRTWVKAGDRLALRFELTNTSSVPVEIGALGIPMPFDAIVDRRSLEEAHAKCSLTDPSIARDAGYVQVTRFTGRGSALLVVPEGKTPLEAWNPLLNSRRESRAAIFTDRTPRGTGFEGFHQWMVHSKAYADNEWMGIAEWNPATSVTLAPGESRTYGVQFALAPEIRAIEQTLQKLKRPVAVGLPGYVLPQDQDGRLFLSYPSDVKSIEVEPKGALKIRKQSPTASAWKAYTLKGKTWGRSRLTITYADDTVQTVHYFVTRPEAEVMSDMGHFLTTKAWFTNDIDPFGRAPSVMTYDREKNTIVTQCQHAWVCGLGDEGGCTWLAEAMKLLGQPKPEEVAKCEEFVDKVIWGGLQYKDGPLKYGVKRTLFYYEPTMFPAGFYSKDVNWKTWMSWSKKHILEVPRTYNYPHVTALYWSLYRIARNTTGLVTHHPWQWYLGQATRTAEAMSRIGTDYIHVGVMDGTIFVELLKDLKREGLTQEAATLEAQMKKREEVWRRQKYPFGSEMPWDSTGQEEVYAWTKYFGERDKAEVCVDAILGYMPALPSWAYNGCARRYWDFVFGGAKIGRIERMIHHYGSSLNALPILAEYRDHPEDIHLLRVGCAGAIGPLANVDQEGFPSMAFHSFPDTMKCDPISGDVGPAIFGVAMNAGAYLAELPEFGWQGFNGNVKVKGRKVHFTPVDAFRQRVYLAPKGLWLTLDAGKLEAIELDTRSGMVRVALAPADAHTKTARLRIEQPAELAGVGSHTPVKDYAQERGASVVPLGKSTTWVKLQAR